MVPLDLYGGMRVELEARDPATDAEIAGVEVTHIVLYSGQPGQSGDLLTSLPHFLTEAAAGGAGAGA